ncbi:MAG TPA: hypothetical protein VME46_15510 [Acidimicrobiales bacterium]|nr:hypothetical protein [Acidimicrobiales bacterium]
MLPARMAATEAWPANAERARKLLGPRGVQVIGSLADAPDQSFELVTARTPGALTGKGCTGPPSQAAATSRNTWDPSRLSILIEHFRGPLPEPVSSNRDPGRERAGAEAAGLVVTDLRTARCHMECYDVAAQADQGGLGQDSTGTIRETPFGWRERRDGLPMATNSPAPAFTRPVTKRRDRRLADHTTAPLGASTFVTARSSVMCALLLNPELSLATKRSGLISSYGVGAGEPGDVGHFYHRPGRGFHLGDRATRRCGVANSSIP